MKSTRTGSSYKEEVLRFIHAKPNGTFTDDRIGVTSAVAEALVATGLPVSAGTVSSAFNTLRSERRLAVEYGHRSLDNHLLITSVTVHAEPHEGVATGPSDPIQRGAVHIATDHRDDVVYQMLRRIVKLMEGQPSISDAEIERFQLHVDHLVDENETWEALAQEAEDGFAETIDDLRDQMELRNIEHQIAVDELKASHDRALREAERRASELRDRAERYRLKIEASRVEAQEAVAAAQTTVVASEVALKESERKVVGVTQKLVRAEETILSTKESERSSRESLVEMKKFSTALAAAFTRREYYLLNDMLLPMTDITFGVFSLFEAVSEYRDHVFIDNDVLVALGIRDLLGQRVLFESLSGVDADAVVYALGKANGFEPLDERGNPLKRNQRSLSSKFVGTVHERLEQIAKVPTLRETLD